MKLRHRTYLVGLGVVALIALAMGSSATLTIHRLSENLNRRLMAAELINYENHVIQARKVLEDTGLSAVREYVDRAKSDLVETFKSESAKGFGVLFIVTRDGDTVLTTPAMTGPLLTPALLQEFTANVSGTQTCRIGNRKQLVHYRFIPQWNWLMLVALTDDKLYSSRNDFIIQSITIFVLVSLVGWVLLVGQAQSLVNPILQLSAAARDIGRGTWNSIPEPSARQDELGDLERDFSQMGTSLRDAYEELETKAESLRTANKRLFGEVEERTRMEQELRKAKVDFETILDSMPSVVIGVDPQLRVNHWNLAAEEQTGLARDKALGMPLEEALPRLASQQGSIREAMHSGVPRLLDKQRFHQDGHRQEDILIYPLRGGSAAGAVIRLDDVTQRVRMEELMVQTEKMMSVGGLAAGMAHELNNPLAGVLTSVQNLRRRLDPTLPMNRKALDESRCQPEALAAYLDARKVDKMTRTIQDAGERAAEIIRSMLNFSRSSGGVKQRADLSAILDESVSLADNDYDSARTYDFRQITILRDYDEGVPEVYCVESEILQVVLNLLRNAAQAMQAEANPDKNPTIMMRLARRRHHAVVEIEDNGPGISETLRSRIFEPFFTTKPVDMGTGLGLSVSYFIIAENHGGSFEVQSTPGRGTLFRFSLPLAGDEAGAA